MSVPIPTHPPDPSIYITPTLEKVEVLCVCIGFPARLLYFFPTVLEWTLLLNNSDLFEISQKPWAKHSFVVRANVSKVLPPTPLWNRGFPRPSSHFMFQVKKVLQRFSKCKKKGCFNRSTVYAITIIGTLFKSQLVPPIPSNLT